MRKSKFVTNVAVFTAIYVTLVYVFQPISFMAIQVRIADIMLGVIPYFGVSGAIGYGLGVFIANTMSPLGVMDLLSAIPSLIGGLVIVWMERKWGEVGYIVSSVINAVIIAIWVAYLLYILLNLPLLPSFIYILIGCLISMTILGYILYISLKFRLGAKLKGALSG